MKELGVYNAVGVTKSRICALIAQSEDVRNALEYKGIDAPYEYDPEDPMTLIWNCIIPVIKNPDTITTIDPQILVGVNTLADYRDPRLVNLECSIFIVLNVADLRANEKYIRSDLLEDGICSFTKPDILEHYIKEALSKDESITWIGDIKFTESYEGTTNNISHYSRVIKFRIQEINTANRGV